MPFEAIDISLFEFRISKCLEKVSGVYILEIGHRYYIGSSKNLRARFYAHRISLTSGRHKNKRLQNLYNKYGAGSVMLKGIEFCNSDEVRNREQLYLDRLKNSERFLLNHSMNAFCSVGGFFQPHSETTKNKISEANKLTYRNGRTTWNKGIKGKSSHSYGKIVSKETRNKLSEANKGKKRSIEQREHLSRINKGHSYTKGIPKPNNRGSKNPSSKLTEDQVLDIKELISNGERISNISIKYGVHECTVYRIKNGSKWQHVQL